MIQALDRDRDEDEDEDFTYPYNMGWKANFAEVFTWTGYPKSDGVVWNVREGCNQFTLTVSFVSSLESECSFQSPFQCYFLLNIISFKGWVYGV